MSTVEQVESGPPSVAEALPLPPPRNEAEFNQLVSLLHRGGVLGTMYDPKNTDTHEPFKQLLEIAQGTNGIVTGKERKQFVRMMKEAGIVS